MINDLKQKNEALHDENQDLYDEKELMLKKLNELTK